MEKLRMCLGYFYKGILDGNYLDLSKNFKAGTVYHNRTLAASEILEILWIYPGNYKCCASLVPCHACRPGSLGGEWKAVEGATAAEKAAMRFFKVVVGGCVGGRLARRARPTR